MSSLPLSLREDFSSSSLFSFRNIIATSLIFFVAGALFGKLFLAKPGIASTTFSSPVLHQLQKASGEDAELFDNAVGKIHMAVKRLKFLKEKATTKSEHNLLQHQFLSLVRKLDDTDFSNYAIDRLRNPDPAFFFKNYVAANKPAIIEGEVTTWKAYGLWSDDYFRQRIGDNVVPVEQSRSNQFYGDRVGRVNITVNEFLDKYTSKSPRYYLAQSSIDEFFPVLQEDFPVAPPVVTKIFTKTVTQLWIGPGDQFTPMHSDELENFLCQIEGSRKLILVPPLQADLVHREEENSYSIADPTKPDYHLTPLFKYAKPIIAELKAGEMMYLPPSWYHYVKSSANRNVAINYWYEVSSTSRQALLRATRIG